MAYIAPLGNFARQRRDWTIETLRYGRQYTIGTNNNLGDVYTLNNDAKDGTSLAVWGILGFYQNTLPMMQAVMLPGLQSKPANVLDFQLYPTSPTVPGYTQYAHANPSYGTTAGIIFLANGIDWFMMPDAPLFILPPNYVLWVNPFCPQGLLQWNSPSFVNFLWGPYTQGKTPRRK